jgi:hypothetical protein
LADWCNASLRGDGKPRVDNDDAGSLGDCLGEFLHLGIVHVLAQVASDQDETLGIPYVGPFRGSRVIPEGQPEPGIPRPAALRERWRRDVGCSESAQRMSQEGSADAMAEKRHRLRTVGT